MIDVCIRCHVIWLGSHVVAYCPTHPGINQLFFSEGTCANLPDYLAGKFDPLCQS